MPIAIEEMSELTKEICKYIRGNDNLNDIVEEIADVQIMVEQLISLFGIESKVNEMIDYKMLRQMQRMEQEKR
jgi:NTP pyrophosphatase (non-canonical NTP hydrolase)